MQLIPSLLLKQLYTNGSLKNTSNGVTFFIKNRLSDATIISITSIKIGKKVFGQNEFKVKLDSGEINPSDVSESNPIDFPVRKSMQVIVNTGALEEGKHKLEISFEAKPFGKLNIKTADSIKKELITTNKIPRHELDDYSDEAIVNRQTFAEKFTGKKFDHIKKYSFDAHDVQGNCEHFVGIAQIPLGIAGPILMNGEHAKGDFLIPMATSEGTLVASYNRGISLLNASGGVQATVSVDRMQRAPVFVFENALQAREFASWIEKNEATIAEQGEATSSIAKLQNIEIFLSNKFTYCRFNWSTGDAAGQNMVGRATFASCSWILDNYKEFKIQKFYLESNFATDKKASQVNIMRTRGKRVTAECTIKRDMLIQRMRVTPEELHYHYQVANMGSFMSGANNNGLHSANGITAIFIATGQDVANVSESSAGLMYCEVTPNGDLYMSITIPSLIIATFGGGTGLATQNECLEMMDCVGRGTAHKFAEIVAGVVLAGEISLASAISSSDWVSSHEAYGRNR